MDHQYYKEYYELERSHWWFQAREKIIVGCIEKLIHKKQLGKDLKILNVGCGTGRSSEYLSAFGKVTSIEYDKFCCEFAKEKTGLEIIHGSITELPFDATEFDLVCAFDVIEHVQDDSLAVSELKRVVKNNGVVFITVPAYMSLWSHHDVINHHFRRYKLDEVKKLFAKADDGKKILSSYFNTFLFPPIYLFRKLSNLMKSGKNRSGSGSDFEAFKPRISNRILYAIMHLEGKFINRNIKFPFGVSILYLWTKNGQHR
ncbi:MAG: class I SAM-dependent methyltransferase [Flavobacterium sp.]|nr:MAG: class I SAM-dependent methyltransferase [Flavobacterium sp.]